jgi:hypothetical protein
MSETPYNALSQLIEKGLDIISKEYTFNDIHSSLQEQLADHKEELSQILDSIHQMYIKKLESHSTHDLVVKILSHRQKKSSLDEITIDVPVDLGTFSEK